MQKRNPILSLTNYGLDIIIILSTVSGMKTLSDKIIRKLVEVKTISAFLSEGNIKRIIN